MEHITAVSLQQLSSGSRDFPHRKTVTRSWVNALRTQGPVSNNLNIQFLCHEKHSVFTANANKYLMLFREIFPVYCQDT
jgi:hypothetical protein